MAYSQPFALRTTMPPRGKWDCSKKRGVLRNTVVLQKVTRGEVPGKIKNRNRDGDSNHALPAPRTSEAGGTSILGKFLKLMKFLFKPFFAENIDVVVPKKSN